MSLLSGGQTVCAEQVVSAVGPPPSKPGTACSDTRVCVRCGWFVFGRERCGRCAGPCITAGAAARGCGVPGIFELLHISPSMRVQNFRSAAK